MNTSKFLCTLAALSFLTDVALAAPSNSPARTQVSQTTEPARTSSPTAAKHKPAVLADAQMDKVTAGDAVNAAQATLAAFLETSAILSAIQKGMHDTNISNIGKI